MTWTEKCSKSLLYPSELLPRDLQRVSQFFIGKELCSILNLAITADVAIYFYSGVELARNGIGLKAYFIPEARSRVTGISATDILTPTVDSLGLGALWSKATSYFSKLPAEYKVTPVIVSVDCVPDAENRLKVYVRTEATHLSALRDMMTLGGQLKGPVIDATLAKLREIWRALFGSISYDTPVRHRDSNTGPTGFLFYYEMALGNPSLTPKIYIPAARLVKNDAHVAQVMSQFVGSSYCDDIRPLL
jgi:DMATS type aromatic prenyltransferase